MRYEIHASISTTVQCDTIYKLVWVRQVYEIRTSW